jgi:hypothetical protein
MRTYNISVFFCAGDKTVVGLLARLCEGDVASRSSSAIFTREKTRCPSVRKMIMKDGCSSSNRARLLQIVRVPNHFRLPADL